MISWNKTVPEMVVEDIGVSLDFWVGLIGFRVAYDRPEDRFAYLDLEGVQVMLEQKSASENQWVTGPLEYPLGRGVNLQIEVDAVEPILQRIGECWMAFVSSL